MDKIRLEKVLPGEIEGRSMEIIDSELESMGLTLEGRSEAPVIRRAIHTSADFDYYHNLKFSEGVMEHAVDVVKQGAVIVTDTNMAKAGINKRAAEKLGCTVECFMADSDVAQKAAEKGTTRATASMEKAAEISGPVIFAIGNAPTALVKLYEMIEEGRISPELVIGVPVGFVNVVEAKELIMKADVPYIVAAGRKGGSNVAAAVVNAILYQAAGRKV